MESWEAPKVMKIIPSVLKDGVPSEVQGIYEPQKLNLDTVDLKFEDKLYLDGTVLKEQAAVTFSGELKSTIRRICGRCLSERDEQLTLPFQFFYDATDDDDIDALDDIRETVLLDQPMTFLCKPDCLGLCPVCGANRNDKVCRCDGSSQGQPFSALKQIRNRIKEE